MCYCAILLSKVCYIQCYTYAGTIIILAVLYNVTFCYIELHVVSLCSLAKQGVCAQLVHTQLVGEQASCRPAAHHRLQPLQLY